MVAHRLLDRVGSGGTAAVYRAEDLVLGRNVALKLLHDCFAEDEEFVERFRLEASRAAGLHHRHIVSVFDRGECDGTHYMTMEYVPGRSLKSLIRDAAPLDPAHAIGLVVQLLRAAWYIHGRGIIHRDLKPDNVIVGFDGQLKLTDFGISRAGASEITQTGTVLGTAQYVSPEQAEGQAVSAATDLYSIGVILYELLTGRVPFEGETVVAILLQHVKERPMAPSARNGAVPRELDAIVMQALEKRPGARFADADAFIKALEHAKAALRLEDTATAATKPDEIRLVERAEPLKETKRMGLASPGAAEKHPEYPPTFAEPRLSRSTPMLIAFLTNLRAVDPQSSSDAATDSLLDGYVAWREACADVSAAYERWIRSLRRDRSLAFAAYLAALEREEHASRVYERRSSACGTGLWRPHADAARAAP